MNKPRRTRREMMANIDRTQRRINTMLHGKRAVKRRAKMEKQWRELDKMMKKLGRLSIKSLGRTRLSDAVIVARRKSTMAKREAAA